jgi:dihydrolipoamide dehydrogenase
LAASAAYDLVIIGSGPGGYVAAIRAAQLGLSTAIVEKDAALGGVCTLRGCIPTKALLHAADLLEETRHGADLGVVAKDLRFELAAAMKHKAKVVRQSSNGIAYLMKKNKVEVHTGFGSLTDAHTVSVSGPDGEKTLSAKFVIIATGSRPRALPIVPTDHETVLDSDSILELKEVPRSLVVIGSGAVGVEFASMFARFGSKTTVVEMLPRLVPVEDEEVSKELGRIYRKRGITCHTGAKMDQVDQSKDGVSVTFTVDGKQQKLDADKILIAVGRKPLTEGIGLEKTAIQPDRGFIKVNPWLQTDEPGVYAIGDIVLGTPQLAHVAMMEGIVAVGKIAGKTVRPIRPERIPNATYCHPEIGSVGLTEAKAREAGYELKVGKFPFTANSRASIVGQHDGFVKIVAEAKHGEILGVHIIGPQATELVAEAVTAMELEGTVEELMFTIHAHPTLAEAMLDASNSVYGLSINV